MVSVRHRLKSVLLLIALGRGRTFWGALAPKARELQKLVGHVPGGQSETPGNEDDEQPRPDWGAGIPKVHQSRGAVAQADDEPGQASQDSQDRRDDPMEQAKILSARLSFEDGARLGDISVEFVYFGAVLLLYDAALEFEGVGEPAVDEGEVLGKQGKPLDRFIRSEVCRQAQDLTIDELMD